MLGELFTYLATPCPWHIRRMGYLYEAIALKGRYIRNKDAWKPHLKHSQRHVMSAAHECTNRGRAVVLGSGLLLDVPIEALSSLFREVVLVDVVCLREVHRRIKTLGNVRFVRGDVTGVAGRLYQGIRLGSQVLPEPEPELPEVDEGTGLVVSLNLLSQLAFMPGAYALKRCGGIHSYEMIDAWKRRLAQSHREALHALSCRVCMIADYAYTRHDRSGKEIEKGSTVSDMALPRPDDSWTWNIAPLGEESPRYSRELTVGAWHRP